MPERKLVARLFPELLQTERSAERHPRIEAERLGDVPPARALLAVAEHASRVLPAARRLAEERHLEAAKAGTWVGTLFSVGRNRLADLLLDAEKSYRGTLLGMRHGIDCVRFLEAAADAEGDAALGAWCAQWLAEREPLVAAVAEQLEWFATHPDRALQRAKPMFGRVGAPPR